MTDIIDDLGNTTAAEVNEMKRQYKDRPQLIKELEAVLNLSTFCDLKVIIFTISDTRRSQM